MEIQNSFEEQMKKLELKKDRVSLGQRLKGKVVLVGSENVFVDIGLKQEAYIERAEFEIDNSELPKPGDEIELFVLSTKGGIRLGRALKGVADLEALKEAYRSEIPVEGKVLALKKGGFSVSLGGRNAFCPLSQITLGPVGDPESYIGKTMTFLICEMDSSGNDIVVSRREVLQRELKEKQESGMKSLTPGKVVKGIVKAIVPYGAFVEVGPMIQGLLHIKDMAWLPPENPEELLAIGQELEMMVKEVTVGPDGKLKISLSLKDLMPDPWSKIVERISVGDVVTGKVKRIVPYGAFVDIGGVEGLVHLSEMSYTKRVLKPEEVVSPGMEIKVMVKSIDAAGRKLSLSIKEVEGDPWADVQDRFRPGDVLEGTVNKRTKEGFLVSLEPGITGYLSRSSILEEGTLDPKSIREQDKLLVEIAEIVPKEKRIRLKIAKRQEDYDGYLPTNSQKLGSLGEYLKKALGDSGVKSA